MAWIESHQSLGNHKKLFALCEALKIERPQAVGHLHLLWWWALDNAPDGDLSGVSDRVLAEVSGFLDGRSHTFGKRFDSVCSSFASALRSTGWIDEDNKLHDWDDYAGKLLSRRERNKDQMRKTREQHVLNTKATRDDTCKATVPNSTVPNSTVPPITPLPPDDDVYDNWLETLHENKIGSLGPKQAAIIDELKQSYSRPDIEAAFERAIEQNGVGRFRIEYIRGILEKMPKVQTKGEKEAQEREAWERMMKPRVSY